MDRERRSRCRFATNSRGVCLQIGLTTSDRRRELGAIGRSEYALAQGLWQHTVIALSGLGTPFSVLEAEPHTGPAFVYLYERVSSAAVTA